MFLLLAVAFILIGAATLVIGFYGNLGGVSQLSWMLIAMGAGLAAAAAVFADAIHGRRVPRAAVRLPATADGGVATDLPSQPVDVDAMFPIDEYDELDADVIIPMLAELDGDELRIVREYEAAGQGRLGIVARIDELVATANARRALPADAFPIPDYDELDVDDILTRLPELDLEELGTVRGRESTGSQRRQILARIEQLAEERGQAAAREDEDSGFPIAEYDELLVNEVLPLLDELDTAELAVVEERELLGARRRAILSHIERRLVAVATQGADGPWEEPTATTAEKIEGVIAAAEPVASRSNPAMPSTETAPAAPSLPLPPPAALPMAPPPPSAALSEGGAATPHPTGTPSASPSEQPPLKRSTSPRSSARVSRTAKSAKARRASKAAAKRSGAPRGATDGWAAKRTKSAKRGRSAEAGSRSAEAGTGGTGVEAGTGVGAAQAAEASPAAEVDRAAAPNHHESDATIRGVEEGSTAASGDVTPPE